MDTPTPTPPPEEQKMRSFRLSKGGGEKKEVPKSAKVIGWIIVAYFVLDLIRTLMDS